mmetsp:Transcript_1394/g.2653  ORF Transcript_1394/g.2653 Transcript_1394/m.2653 type:complete len:126 (+) Transcript_1394:55-432(+)
MRTNTALLLSVALNACLVTYLSVQMSRSSAAPLQMAPVRMASPTARMGCAASRTAAFAVPKRTVAPSKKTIQPKRTVAAPKRTVAPAKKTVAPPKKTVAPPKKTVKAAPAKKTGSLGPFANYEKK